MFRILGHIFEVHVIIVIMVWSLSGQPLIIIKFISTAVTPDTFLPQRQMCQELTTLHHEYLPFTLKLFITKKRHQNVAKS